MAVCFKCGATDKEKDTWRYCSCRKEYVCKQCEEMCNHYSERMLSNGTHCRMTFLNPVVYLANSDETEKQKAKYATLDDNQVKEKFKEIKKQHEHSDDLQVRANLRVHLRALSEMIIERRIINL